MRGAILRPVSCVTSRESTRGCVCGDPGPIHRTARSRSCAWRSLVRDGPGATASSAHNSAPAPALLHGRTSESTVSRGARIGSAERIVMRVSGGGMPCSFGLRLAIESGNTAPTPRPASRLTGENPQRPVMHRLVRRINRAQPRAARTHSAPLETTARRGAHDILVA